MVDHPFGKFVVRYVEVFTDADVDRAADSVCGCNPGSAVLPAFCHERKRYGETESGGVRDSYRAFSKRRCSFFVHKLVNVTKMYLYCTLIVTLG